MRTIGAGEFKAKCLKIMDEVAATGEPVLVTKRGKPVVRVTAPESRGTFLGRLSHMVKPTGSLDNLVDPIIETEEWDHLKDDWSPFPPK